MIEEVRNISNKKLQFVLFGYLLIYLVIFLVPRTLNWIVPLLLLSIALSIPIIIGGKNLFKLMGCIAFILPLFLLYTLIVVADTSWEARQVKAKMDIEIIIDALDQYKKDIGTYPSVEKGLKALVEPPDEKSFLTKWKIGGYLKNGQIPKDPWGNDYIYNCPGKNAEVEVISYGADGKPGGNNKNMDIKVKKLKNWD